MITNRFDRAIQALITAFFDGTLAKGHCSACAVGNMVTAGYGAKVGKDFACELKPDAWMWGFMFQNGVVNDIEDIDERYIKQGLESIKVTDYSIRNLVLVERAFEDNTIYGYDEYSEITKEQIMEDQYKGLVAVFNVLCEIEGKNSNEYCKMLEYDSNLQPVNN